MGTNSPKYEAKRKMKNKTDEYLKPDFQTDVDAFHNRKKLSANILSFNQNVLYYPAY